MPVEIDVDHVARLARLALSSEEKDRMHRQLGVILDHAAKVREVAAEDVPPTSSPIPGSSALRADEPRSGLSREDALAGAPEAEGGRFRVPRVVEQE